MTENNNKGFLSRWGAKLWGGEKSAAAQEPRTGSEANEGYNVELGWKGIQQNYTIQVERVEQSLQAAQAQLPPEMAQRVQNQIDSARQRLAKYQEQPTSREEVNTRWQELLLVARSLNLDGLDRALIRIADGVSIEDSKIEASFPQKNPTPEGVSPDRAWQRELQIYDINVKRAEDSLAAAADHLSAVQHNGVQRLINRSRTLLAQSQAVPEAAEYPVAVQTFKDAGKQVPLYRLDLELRMIGDKDKSEDERKAHLVKLDEILKANE